MEHRLSRSIPNPFQRPCPKPRFFMPSSTCVGVVRKASVRTLLGTDTGAAGAASAMAAEEKKANGSGKREGGSRGEGGTEGRR